MKKTSINLALLLLTLLALPFAGCRTTPETSSPWRDAAFVDKTALFLKASVANSVVVAVSEEDKAESYCRLVREALAKLQGGANTTPGDFEQAILSVPVNELQGKYARLAVANLSLAYELYWSQAVAAKVESSAIAAKMIKAAIEGIDLGLLKQAPEIPNKPPAS